MIDFHRSSPSLAMQSNYCWQTSMQLFFFVLVLVHKESTICKHETFVGGHIRVCECSCLCLTFEWVVNCQMEIDMLHNTTGVYRELGKYGNWCSFTTLQLTANTLFSEWFMPPKTTSLARNIIAKHFPNVFERFCWSFLQLKPEFNCVTLFKYPT